MFLNTSKFMRFLGGPTGLKISETISRPGGLRSDRNSKTTFRDQKYTQSLEKWPQKPPQAADIFSQRRKIFCQTFPKNSDNRIRQRFVHHAEGVQLKLTNVAGFRNLTSFLQRVNKFHTMSNY